MRKKATYLTTVLIGTVVYSVATLAVGYLWAIIPLLLYLSFDYVFRIQTQVFPSELSDTVEANGGEAQ